MIPEIEAYSEGEEEGLRIRDDDLIHIIVCGLFSFYGNKNRVRKLYSQLYRIR